VHQDIEEWRLQATVQLRTVPGPGVELLVGFGARRARSGPIQLMKQERSLDRVHHDLGSIRL
jgi:hypothetical protein